MNSIDLIDLSSDEEDQAPNQKSNNQFESELQDFKFLQPLALISAQTETPPGILSKSTKNAILVKHEAEPLNSIPNFTLNGGNSTQSLRPICRQFWKSGDYEVKKSVGTSYQNGRNRLRINPRFLHSNATSHKWAFGAIAELLDNAIDEVNNGATLVKVDKFICPHDGNPALLIQDDGGGMDPESLRRCISFGFSDKQSDAFIGQYGNGFKTSTMRLGADVIVFTRCKKQMKTTQSVGLLSYTFLTRTGLDDIVVPTVDYEFDPKIGFVNRLIRSNEKQFQSTLSILFKWSPFSTEEELCKQFDDIGDNGTKVLVYNLWHNDDGDVELDFLSDPLDIIISGARKKAQLTKLGFQRKVQNLTQNNIAIRLCYSLRAYASVLYLHMPDNFKINLRGEIVEPHRIANDLMYRECIVYRPNVAGVIGAAVVTTIGYEIGAPNIDVEGFNVYHKNRLISPFWKVATNSYGKGRGVVGILEANFIKPTHDKQDFEKSVLYQRLEVRLKEMTYEYWDLHCHLVGYDNKKLPKNVRQSFRLPPPNNNNNNNNPLEITAATRTATPSHSNSPKSSSLLKLSIKRKNGSQNFNQWPATYNDNDTTDDSDDDASIIKEFPKKESTPNKRQNPGMKHIHEMKTIFLENKTLKSQCAEFETAHRKLIVKEQMLRSQFELAKREYQELLTELNSLIVKTEKFR
ncbi:hypothetical protein LUZ60_001022 [Juncus effusus]|nr:hypothetical protein LUZ60_001022 [Juncus effusus]